MPDRFKVVVNHEGQYSIWPAERENAPGWSDEGYVGPREDCLAHVARVWVDMRPRSLRDHLDNAAGKHGAWAGRRGPARLAHQLVETQVDRTPDAPAVLTDYGSISYRELDERANRLAHLLAEHGVRPEVLVGICLERTEDIPVAVLAVWKAGGAFVPLDPRHPIDLLRVFAQDAPMRVVLAHKATAGVLPPVPDPLILDELAPLDMPPDRLLPSASPDNLTHVMFTSGSTGRPKGVAGTHRGVLNLIEVFAARMALTPDDLVAAVTALSFDPSLIDLLAPLMCGSRLTIVDARTAGDPTWLRERVAEVGATVLQSTASRWKLLMAAGGVARAVRLRMSTGEVLPRDLAERMGADGATVWDLYGPTETTVYATHSEVATESGPIPLGRPIPGTRLYVLDENLDELPVGEIGEVYIGGVGVARGYYGRPDLTADRFLPDPFDAPGKRTYRTGDLARLRVDGRFDFRGRADHQVKFRGYRIELGEVEAVLREHPWVRDAIVITREDALFAYVVSRAPGVELWPMLRSWLRTRLPEYMVPDTGLTVAAFPLNPNGKVDRAALPAPRGEACAIAYAAPRTAMERVVSTVWRELLDLDRVGLHDNFFDVGGNSMLLMRMRTRLQEALGREVDILAGLRHPTVQTLARHLADGAAAAVRPGPERSDRRLTGLEVLRDRRRRGTGGGS